VEVVQGRILPPVEERVEFAPTESVVDPWDASNMDDISSES
jgi:hypothetical protein